MKLDILSIIEMGELANDLHTDLDLAYKIHCFPFKCFNIFSMFDDMPTEMFGVV